MTKEEIKTILYKLQDKVEYVHCGYCQGYYDALEDAVNKLDKNKKKIMM